MHRWSTRGAIGVLLWLLASPVLAEDRIVSFINDSGVRVYTNFPSRGNDSNIVQESTRPTALTIPKDARGADLFRPLIVESAERHGVDAELVEAVMAVESAFDPFAVSQKDCKGLMQLHPDTARRFGVDDVFDPAQNIEGGVKYLKYLLDFFDNELTKVLAAYNAGENAVERYGGTPPYRETQDYLRKIASRYDLSRTTSQENSEPRIQRVQRIELPDGRILYTNARVDTISQ